MLFKKYIDFYFEYKKTELKPSTLHKYNSILQIYIYPYFAEMTPQEANNVHNIRKFILNLENQSIKGTLTNKFKREVIMVLKGCLDEAFFDEAIPKNNIYLLRALKIEKPNIDPFSYKEVKKLLDNATGFFRVYLYIAFYTGMRVGEILALEDSDIDLKKNLITVNKTRGKFGIGTPKTKTSIRQIPIFKPLKDILYDFITGTYTRRFKKSNSLFVNQYGNAFNSSKNINLRHYKPLLKKCKLKYRRLYETRHTFATNMLISGKLSVNEISRILGHANTQMLFTVYTSYIESEHKEINTIFDLYEK